jgi:predicted site-specific integrase-resolvase
LYKEALAAELLKVSVKTLQRWRWEGQGPRFLKLRRPVRYTETDLIEFLRRSERSSTTE